jgi:multimeric flavodoxin WrbA
MTPAAAADKESQEQWKGWRPLNISIKSSSPDHLEKSFINPVSNAAEAMPNRGTLSVRTASCCLDKHIFGVGVVLPDFIMSPHKPRGREDKHLFCPGMGYFARKERVMRVMAFNGSPRKEWNTATLLKHALEGAASRGAQTELVHLYDLNFRGCRSCFACKTRDAESYGCCAVQDDLAPVLERVEKADGLILGSPIYFGTVSGEMKSCLERLLFPYLVYTNPPQSLFSRSIPTGFIYTMNVTAEQMAGEYSFSQHLAWNERVLKLIFGVTESLLVFDTLQFDDYSKVVADRFDPQQKAKRRAEVFPHDCGKAFALGARLVGRQP